MKLSYISHEHDEQSDGEVKPSNHAVCHLEDIFVDERDTLKHSEKQEITQEVNSNCYSYSLLRAQVSSENRVTDRASLRWLGEVDGRLTGGENELLLNIKRVVHCFVVGFSTVALIVVGGREVAGSHNNRRNV